MLKVTTQALKSMWTNCNIPTSDGDMEPTQSLDATGLLCPLPVLKAAKRLRSMASGEVLKVLADDPAAVVDIPHFCNEQGHELLNATEDGGVQKYIIKRK